MAQLHRLCAVDHRQVELQGGRRREVADRVVAGLIAQRAWDDQVTDSQVCIECEGSSDDELLFEDCQLFTRHLKQERLGPRDGFEPDSVRRHDRQLGWDQSFIQRFVRVDVKPWVEPGFDRNPIRGARVGTLAFRHEIQTDGARRLSLGAHRSQSTGDGDNGTTDYRGQTHSHAPRVPKE